MKADYFNIHKSFFKDEYKMGHIHLKLYVLRNMTLKVALPVDNF